jgi:hypothetical protein
VGVVEVDGGLVAFADPMHLSETIPLVLSTEGWRPLPEESRLPRQLVALGTGGDMSLLVEIQRGADGAIVVARIAFVDDLDDLAGEWVEVGLLEIGGSGCMAIDPSVPYPKARRVRFELRPGTYVAEAFVWNDDDLAFRLRPERGDA